MDNAPVSRQRQQRIRQRLGRLASFLAASVSVLVTAALLVGVIVRSVLDPSFGSFSILCIAILSILAVLLWLAARILYRVPVCQRTQVFRKEPTFASVALGTFVVGFLIAVLSLLFRELPAAINRFEQPASSNFSTGEIDLHPLPPNF